MYDTRCKENANGKIWAKKWHSPKQVKEIPIFDKELIASRILNLKTLKVIWTQHLKNK